MTRIMSSSTSALLLVSRSALAEAGVSPEHLAARLLAEDLRAEPDATS